jgi:peptidoglycan hydrolase-like protein with peptidoglycan-binding domain
MKFVALAVAGLMGSVAFASEAAKTDAATKTDTGAETSLSNNTENKGIIELSETQIRKVQNALVAQGAALVVNGKLGKDTVDALAAFQEKNNLFVSGTIDQATLAKLGVAE